jgi:ABC-2 type transport system ATP-binding protein
MRQRIGLAKTLMHDPKVVFLDEPANGLDPRARIDMRNLIRKLADMGKTVLVSSHILPELGNTCDVLGIIERGRLLAFGTLSQIMAQVRPNRVVEMEFLGQPAHVMEVAKELMAKRVIHKVNIFENILQFEITGDDVELAKIHRYFMVKKVNVIWFREQEANLEEAFMTITDADAVAGQRRVDDTKPAKKAVADKGASGGEVKKAEVDQAVKKTGGGVKPVRKSAPLKGGKKVGAKKKIVPSRKLRKDK